MASVAALTNADGPVDGTLGEVLGSYSVSMLEPLRELRAYHGRTSRVGYLSAGAMRRSVPYESLLEASNLKWLSFDPTVSRVATQALALEIPDLGTHYVDFVVEFADGEHALVDVRHSDLLDDEALDVFDATAEICASEGLSYYVLQDDHRDLRSVASHYHQFATSFAYPLDHLLSILDLIADGADSIELLAAGLGSDDRGYELGAIKHLLWCGEIAATQFRKYTPVGLRLADGSHHPRRNFRRKAEQWAQQRTNGTWKVRTPGRKRDQVIFMTDKRAVWANMNSDEKQSYQREFDAYALYAEAHGRGEDVRQLAAFVPEDQPNPYVELTAEHTRRLIMQTVMRGVGDSDRAPEGSTFYERMKSARQTGEPWGLLHDSKTASALIEKFPKFFKLAKQMLEEQSDLSHRSKRAIRFDLLTVIKETNKKRDTPIALPGITGQEKLITQAMRATGTAGRRRTVRGAQPVPDVFGSWTEEQPGNLMLDHSPVDIRLLHPSQPGKHVRVELSVLWDIASQQPVAISIHDVGARADDVLDLIYQLSADESLDGEDISADGLLLDMTDGELLGAPGVVPGVYRYSSSDDMLKWEPALRRFAPVTIHIDNGSAETSHRFRRFARSLGLRVQLANLGTGYHKSMVERFFRTLASMLCQQVAGSTGNSAEERGKDPDLVADRTPAEFEQQMLEFCHMWRSRPSEFAYRFGQQKMTLTPDVYLELVKEKDGLLPPLQLPLGALIEGMHHVERMLSKGQIRYLGHYYGRGQLEDLRGYDQPLPIAVPRGRGSPYIYVAIPGPQPSWRRLELYTPAVPLRLTARERDRIVTGSEAYEQALSKAEADHELHRIASREPLPAPEVDPPTDAPNPQPSAQEPEGNPKRPEPLEISIDPHWKQPTRWDSQ